MKLNKIASVQRAFTLVELIVVVGVLAVLATISFSTVGNVTSNARDSARLTDINTIVSKMEMQLSLGKPLPKPANAVALMASGNIVGYQGDFDASAARTLDLNEIKDPLDKTYYIYTTDAALQSYQVFGYKEKQTAFSPVISVFADNKTFFTKGKVLGILLQTSDFRSISEIFPNSQVDIINTSSGLTAVFTDSKSISGTGFSF